MMAMLGRIPLSWTCIKSLGLSRIHSWNKYNKLCSMNSMNRCLINYTEYYTGLRYCQSQPVGNSPVESSNSKSIRTEKSVGPEKEVNDCSQDSVVSLEPVVSVTNKEFPSVKLDHEQVDSVDRQRETVYNESGIVDYSYFRNIITTAKTTTVSPLNRVVDIRREQVQVDLSKEDVQGTGSMNNLDNDFAGKEIILEQSKPKEIKIYGLKNIKPKPPIKSATLAPFVNENEVLIKFVSLGVNLQNIEKDVQASNFILKCDWGKHIQPYMVFLHQIGVPDSDLGSFISKFPSVFLTHMDDLQVRLDYFKSKRFPKKAVAHIVTKAPTILNLTVKQIDANLGFLQKEFRLKGEDVRQVVLKCPKIAIYDKRIVQMVKLHVQEFMGYSEEEVRKMVTRMPKVFLDNKNALEKRNSYMVKEMGIPQSFISENPSILRTRLFILKQRHQFLKKLGRNQYDPTKENYVHLISLVRGKDTEFCTNIAKAPVETFRDFIKTL